MSQGFGVAPLFPFLGHSHCSWQVLFMEDGDGKQILLSAPLASSVHSTDSTWIIPLS